MQCEPSDLSFIKIEPQDKTCGSWTNYTITIMLNVDVDNKDQNFYLELILPEEIEFADQL